MDRAPALTARRDARHGFASLKTRPITKPSIVGACSRAYATPRTAYAHRQPCRFGLISRTFDLLQPFELLLLESEIPSKISFALTANLNLQSFYASDLSFHTLSSYAPMILGSDLTQCLCLCGCHNSFPPYQSQIAPAGVSVGGATPRHVLET
jgi:hypothetical protein